MKWTTKQSVLATLIYSGMFDYPLTEAEINRFLITPKKQKTPKHINSVLGNLPHKNNFYSNDHIVKRLLLREKRKEFSRKKWEIVKNGAFFLSFIPTVDFIGVSGGLSMNNASEEDDIDLFIICYSQTIWITRLCVLFVLALMGKRRKFGVVNEKNLLCPNMFVTSSHVRLPYKEQDLYSAHEVVQVEPLFVRGTIYQHFILENEWVRDFLPNAWLWAMRKVQQADTYPVHIGIWVGRILFIILNPLVKIPQKIIISFHKTNEIVTDTILRFHPNDARSGIHKEFVRKLKEYDIPLDSLFFRVLR